MKNVFLALTCLFLAVPIQARTIAVAEPVIDISPTSLFFSAVQGGANPADQILTITNIGDGTLYWQISCDCDWLIAEPNTGSSTGDSNEVVVSVDINSLPSDTYICDLVISDPNAENNPQIAQVTSKVYPIGLYYDAEAYSYTYAQKYGGGDSDSDNVFSTNSQALAYAGALDLYLDWCGIPNKTEYYIQRSSMKVSVEGNHDRLGAWINSVLKGWGSWSSYSGCSGQSDSGDGGGDGNGYSSMTGTIRIGVPPGYPAGSAGLILKLGTHVAGDYGTSWGNWDWWLKVWDQDPCAPLVLLNDANLSAELDVESGQVLNFSFYHEGARTNWPEAGLQGIVNINLEVFPSADINRNRCVDFHDYAILASQWLQIPSITAADIMPPYGGDGIIDINDLACFLKGWLWCQDTTSPPIAHWKFDDASGSTASDSAGDNDGTINSAIWTTGQINGALDFNGVNDYVNCGSSASLAMGSSRWTAAAWFKTSNNKQYNGILTTWNGGGSSDCYRIVVYDDATAGGALGKVSFVIYDGSECYYVRGATVVTDNDWHHVAGVRDSTHIRIYVDGNEENSALIPSSAFISNSADFSIGEGFSGGWSFDGKIDDVRVYDRALSAAELLQLYESGLGGRAFAPGPADEATGVDLNTTLSWSPGTGALSHDVYLGTAFGDVNDANTTSAEYMGNQTEATYDPCGLDPDTTYYWRINEVAGPNTVKGYIWSFKTRIEPNFVSWWEFDDGTGSTAADSAGGGNDGTIYGATWTTGQINGALSFDGNNDYVMVGDKTSLEPAELTLSFWAQLDNPSGSTQGGIAKGYIFGSATEFSYRLDFHNGNARAGLTNTSNIYYGASTSIPDSDWHMWSMTAGSGILRIYRDGYQQGSDIPYVGPIDYTKNNNHFVIGARSNGDYSLDGKIDDVRVYNRALSAADVLQLYNDGL